jgi:Uma2 family endonuclease
MTAEEFFEWVHRPENDGKEYELERGSVVEVPRPDRRHGFVCANLAWVLGGYVRQRRQGYACGNGTGVIWERNPDTVLGPDVILYAEKRRFADLSRGFAERVPLLAVEVLSPNDRLGKVNLRIQRFLDWGVRLVWLVDPEDCAVTVYRPDRAHQVFQADQELTGGELLPDFRCRVADLFYLPGEAPDTVPPAS